MHLLSIWALLLVLPLAMVSQEKSTCHLLVCKLFSPIRISKCIPRSSGVSKDLYAMSPLLDVCSADLPHWRCLATEENVQLDSIVCFSRNGCGSDCIGIIKQLAFLAKCVLSVTWSLKTGIITISSCIYS